MANILNKIFKKSVISTSVLDEGTRDGINKAYIPKFLYKPPFGFPRYANIGYLRYLSQTPYMEMVLNTIIDEIASVPWDVLPNDGVEDELVEGEVSNIKNFFNNPNTNQESFEEVFIRQPVRDLLEIGNGVLNKVYNLKEELVEVVARDAGTFTKNPDIHGMMTDREDILLPKEIIINPNEVVNSFQQMSDFTAREDSAYFQYGWISGPVPVPFGKKEIIWIEKSRRTDEIYAFSPVQIVANTLQTLLYMIDSDLEYFNNNNVPKGILGFEDSDSEEINSFQKQWFDQQYSKDAFGNLKKMVHRIPFVNKVPKFERMEFTSNEMQLIEKQRWYSKLIWSQFGVTPTELGYTEDAKGQANQIVQSKVFRKRAVNPVLRLLENKYNSQIVEEFSYVSKFKDNGIEMPKYKFVFKRFDTDEERAKTELFKLQIESGIKTVNEIRVSEGAEEVEWGDEPPKNFMAGGNGMNFDFGGMSNNSKKPNDDNDDSTGKEPPMKEPKEEMSKEEKKDFIQTVQEPFNPLIIKENESIAGYKRFEQAIKHVLNIQEEAVLKALDSEMNSLNIQEIKSIEEKDLSTLIAALKRFINFSALSPIVNASIKHNYLKGWESSEKLMDRNFVPESHAMDYISDYTFENVKGMEADLANKLRGVFKRGFMDGSSTSDLKAEIRKVFKVEDNRAEAIARTETNRANNFGRLQAFQKSDEKVRKWLNITYDNRTSEISKAMGRKYGIEDKAIDINENFNVVVNGKTISGPAPPFHVNERDVLMFTDKEFAEQKSLKMHDSLINVFKNVALTQQAELDVQKARLETEEKVRETAVKKSELLNRIEGNLE